MEQQKPWREFERLITRIEKMLAPMGAEIKSPDRIPDKVTGQLREVDASIRHTVGSAPVLITVECRNRKGKQDVQWLEQVKSKKDSVGANQTIVVALDGFTAPAREYASQHGLVVREVGEVEDELVKCCQEGIKINISRLGYESLSYNIDVYPTEKDEGKEGISLPLSVHEKISKDQYFAFDENGEGITLSEILQECFDMVSDRIRYELERSGLPRIKTQMSGELEPGNISVETEDGTRFIRTILFEVECFISNTELPALKPVSYLDEEGKKVVSFSETYDPVTREGIVLQFDWDDDGKRITKSVT